MSDLTEEDEDAIRILLGRKGDITEWEIGFLECVSEQGWMSVIQRGIFDEIWERITRI